jgi:predicted secreted protein
MALVAGRVGKIAVSSDGGSTYVDVGGVKDATLNASKAMLDATTKDSGAYKEFEDGHKEATIELTLSWDDSATGLDAGQEKIVDAFEGNSALLARFRMEEGSGFKEHTSSVKVSAISEAQPLEDMAAFTATLQLTGSFASATQ